MIDTASSDNPLLRVRVSLKEDASIAAVQTGLRNEGFDQKLWNEEENFTEGVIHPDQVEGLSRVAGVDSVKTLREVWT